MVRFSVAYGYLTVVSGYIVASEKFLRSRSWRSVRFKSVRCGNMVNHFANISTKRAASIPETPFVFEALSVIAKLVLSNLNQFVKA